MESVWIFKLGLWFLMNSISKTKQSNLPGTFLKFWLVFFQEVVATVSFHEMSTDRRIFVLSNALMKVSGCVPDIICIAQITWETVYTQRIADSLLTAWFLWVGDLAPISCSQCRLQCGENLMAKIAQLLPNRTSGHLIFEWKTNSYCATIIGVSFRCACLRISKNKIIDSGINKAWCDCGSVRANRCLLVFGKHEFQV